MTITKAKIKLIPILLLVGKIVISVALIIYSEQ